VFETWVQNFEGGAWVGGVIVVAEAVACEVEFVGAVAAELGGSRSVVSL
jgi:hypothetical protein